MTKTPLVSVIIPTKNEAQNISRCLTSVKSQTYPLNQLQIIIIDNHSIDNTVSLAKKFTPFVFQHGPERSAQRNLGLQKATGQYFLYLDADMTVSKNLIKNSVSYLKSNPKIIGLYLKETISGSSLFVRWLNYQRQKYTATPIDAPRFIRTKALKKIKGFDQKLNAFEDWDLTIRLKKIGPLTLLNQTDCIAHHLSRLTPLSYFQKKLYYLRSLPLYLEKTGLNHPDIRYQLNPFNRL